MLSEKHNLALRTEETQAIGYVKELSTLPFNSV